MHTPIDWSAIRLAYEQDGISQRTLARKYGVSQPVISKRAKKEGWNPPRTITLGIAPIPTDTPQEDPHAILALTDKALQGLSGFVEDPKDLSLKDHKLFADALSQYHKIRLTSPDSSDKHTASGLPANLLPYLTLEELATIETILKQAEERRMSAEQEAGIRQIGRKVG